MDFRPLIIAGATIYPTFVAGLALATTVPWSRPVEISLTPESKVPEQYLGLGFSEITFDISATIANLPAALTRVELRVMHPSEQVAVYPLDIPAVLPVVKAVGADLQVYEEDVTTTLGTTTNQFLSMRHEFPERGTYRIALTFHYGTDQEYITTRDAMIIRCGDGFHQGAY
jgi:hypothetical protein